jgi:hypothetical protein
MKSVNNLAIAIGNYGEERRYNARKRAYCNIYVQPYIHEQVDVKFGRPAQNGNSSTQLDGCATPTTSHTCRSTSLRRPFIGLRPPVATAVNRLLVSMTSRDSWLIFHRRRLDIEVVSYKDGPTVGIRGRNRRYVPNHR